MMLSVVPQARPRERMMLFGPHQLSVVELLALILGGGHSLDRGSAVLADAGGLRALVRAGPQQLSRTPGIGVAGATAICAAFELGKRVASLDVPYAQPFEERGDIERFLLASLGDSTQETFVVLGLDARRCLQMIRTVAVGSAASVHVHPREVFRPLVEAGMHAVIVVHNHPSGRAEPSDADLLLTHRLTAVGQVLGIPVLDHFIVSRERVVSMVEQGLL